MPARWLDYGGHYLHGDRVVLSYAIDGRGVFEAPWKPGGYGAIEHTLRVGRGAELKLCVAQLEGDVVPATGYLKAGATSSAIVGEGAVAVMGLMRGAELGRFVAASVVGEGGGWSFDASNRLVLTIPASEEEAELTVIRFAGTGEAELLAFATYVDSRGMGLAGDSIEDLTGGGELRWAGELSSSAVLGQGDRAYTLDTIGLPRADNPWNVWFRTSALAFFPDGRMVVSTHGGDVWIVSGVDGDLQNLRWKRFAAGMYEPFGLQVVDGLIYVTCKDRITRLHDLNRDGEADFYESFSADDDVSAFFHAFNFDLQRDSAGNFYYAKSGQYTDYALPGSVIKVSPDGKSREVYCTGFRTPNGMGVLPDGRVTVSDNQGNWMPASKVSLCRPGGFYGYVQTHAKPPNWAPDGGEIDHKKVVPPKSFDPPLIWMPQDFDNSSGGQLWVDDARWGPLSNKLLHTSFGKGWLYYMMLQEVDGVAQAAIVKLDLDCDTGIHRARVNPSDGQVYAVGLNGWNGGGRKGLAQGGIHRFRFTGAESKLLTGANVTSDGIRLSFNFRVAAADRAQFEIEQWNYRWSANYGSKRYSLEHPGQVGSDQLAVEDVIVAPDRTAVVLKIPTLRPVDQLKLRLKVAGEDGGELDELVYFTINRLPAPH